MGGADAGVDQRCGTGADLRSRTRRTDRQRGRSCTGAEENEREREREADPERAWLLGDPDPKRSQRVMQAMLKMKKIEIDDLERAAAQAWRPAPPAADDA